jgi:hypothetical protein
LEGKGEFSIHNLEISEGHLLQEGKEILDELIASAGYKAVEGKLLKKKREECEGRGEKVKNHGREEKRVFTCYGWFTIPRTVLEIESGQETGGRKRRETPLDEFLGIKALPHKATALAMERSARWGQAMTYKDCEELFKEEFHIDVTDSYLHEITDYVGEKMLEEDKQGAKEWEVMLESGKGVAAMTDIIPPKATKKGVFYIMIDGSMLNMRDSQDEESSW